MPWGAAAVLGAWETGGALTPPARAAALLALDGRAADPAEALDLDVATAVGRLAASYRESFGARVDAVVACPSCGELLEAELTMPSLGSAARRTADLDGWSVRAPTLAELVAVASAPDGADMLRELCLSPVGPDAAEVAPDRLETVMEELAGAAALHSAVTCAACGTRFDTELDVLALLWERICVDARRLLEDVAVLATAFGWSEREILDLPESRRERYLVLSGASR